MTPDLTAVALVKIQAAAWAKSLQQGRGIDYYLKSGIR